MKKVEVKAILEDLKEFIIEKGVKEELVVISHQHGWSFAKGFIALEVDSCIYIIESMAICAHPNEIIVNLFDPQYREKFLRHITHRSLRRIPFRWY